MIYLVRSCNGGWLPLWMHPRQEYAGLSAGDHGAPYCRIRWFRADTLVGDVK